MIQKFLLLFILLSLYLFANAQKKREIRAFISDTKLVRCDIDGEELKDSNKNAIKLPVRADWKFTFDRLSNGKIRIKFLRWKVDGSGSNKVMLKNRNEEYCLSEEDQVIYFILPNEKFENITQTSSRLPRVTFTAGGLTLPLRLRFQSQIDPALGKREIPFDYTPDINVGLTAGIKVRLNNEGNQCLNLLLGGSITSGDADASNTRGYLSSNARIGLLTPSLSVVYQTDNLHIIISVGKDYPPGELYDKWIYRGRAWLGFGIGINLFSIKKGDKQ